MAAAKTVYCVQCGVSLLSTFTKCPSCGAREFSDAPGSPHIQQEPPSTSPPKSSTPPPAQVHAGGGTQPVGQINPVTSYIKRHWRGENSLAWAFWINGLLLNLIVNAAIHIVFYEIEIINNLMLIPVLLIGHLGFYLWASLGIWRSARNYAERARVSAPQKPSFWAHSPFWAYAAKLFVIVGVLQTVGNSVPMLRNLNAALEVQDSNIATRFYIDCKKHYCTLNGFINQPSVVAVKKALIKNGEPSALMLNSPGGFLVSAFKLADFVEQRELIVAAKDDCHSACLLVLAAAKSAYVTPETLLVFHHPETIGDFHADSEVAKAELNIYTREYYARFKRYGVPEGKLLEYRQQRTKVLVIGEAHDSNIVDGIWDPRTDKIYDCKQVNCFELPIKLP